MNFKTIFHKITLKKIALIIILLALWLPAIITYYVAFIFEYLSSCFESLYDGILDNRWINPYNRNDIKLF